MIQVAISLAIVGWIASLAKGSKLSELKASTSPYNPASCPTCEAILHQQALEEVKDLGAPMMAQGFDPAMNCGDIITDYNIQKTVEFKALAGTSVEGLSLRIRVCHKEVAHIKLNNVPQNNGVNYKPESWNTKLFAGNYTLTIENTNGTDMPNDGNLGDNQIGVYIDGFAIGELPMTMAQDSETYNLIVNPD